MPRGGARARVDHRVEGRLGEGPAEHRLGGRPARARRGVDAHHVVDEGAVARERRGRPERVAVRGHGLRRGGPRARVERPEHIGRGGVGRVGEVRRLELHRGALSVARCPPRGRAGRAGPRCAPRGPRAHGTGGRRERRSARAGREARARRDGRHHGARVAERHEGRHRRDAHEGRRDEREARPPRGRAPPGGDVHRLVADARGEPLRGRAGAARDDGRGRRLVPLREGLDELRRGAEAIARGLQSARANTASTAGGISPAGRHDEGGGGFALRWRITMAITSSLFKGRRPESISRRG